LTCASGHEWRFCDVSASTLTPAIAGPLRHFTEGPNADM